MKILKSKLKSGEKMKHIEIYIALECCAEGNCYICPLKYSKEECFNKLIRNTLELVNYQKATIDRLQEGEMRSDA